MKTPRIEEILVLSKDAWDMSYDLDASQVKLDEALTEAHQAGKDEAVEVAEKQKTYTGGSSVEPKDIRINKQDLIKALQDNK